MNNLLYRDIYIANKCSYRDVSRYRRLRMKVISRQHCSILVCATYLLFRWQSDVEFRFTMLFRLYMGKFTRKGT